MHPLAEGSSSNFRLGCDWPPLTAHGVGPVWIYDHSHFVSGLSFGVSLRTSTIQETVLYHFYDQTCKNDVLNQSLLVTPLVILPHVVYCSTGGVPWSSAVFASVFRGDGVKENVFDCGYCSSHIDWTYWWWMEGSLFRFRRANCLKKKIIQSRHVFFHFLRSEIVSSVEFLHCVNCISQSSKRQTALQIYCGHKMGQ